MPLNPEIEVEVASYPEFENLVAEVKLGSQLTIVVSKEPGEDDFGITFHGLDDAANAPSYSGPQDVSRVKLADVLAAIDRGREALET